MKFIQSILLKLKDWLNDKGFPKRPFNQAGKAILLISLLFFSIVLLSNVYRSATPGYYYLLFIVYFVIVFLTAILTAFLAKIIGKFPWVFLTAANFVIIGIVKFYRGLTDPFTWILITVIVVITTLSVCGIVFMKKTKTQKIGIVLSGLSTGVILAFIFLFFIYRGSELSDTPNFKLTANLPPHIEAPNPARPGDLKVTRLSYGSGNDKHRPAFGPDVSIRTEPVDASHILETWKGFYGNIRSYFFGFDETQLPLNALVWLPQDIKEPLPLVLILHGNHLAEEFSEEGYTYLAELLASRGYIVASVDQNFLNISSAELTEHLKKENATRGWLLLKHLELWRRWNSDSTSIFYQKVDLNNIALIGHSRGGEAILHAALFNRLPCYPDNATLSFNFNFNIKSLVAIAPVDGQYKPGKTLAPLDDINYLVLHGSKDMDMKSYGGLATYHRIRFSNEFVGFKAGLYIDGANHGQFNSIWGRHDQSYPAMNQYNTYQIMSEQKQQEIAKVYVSAFLDNTLKGNRVYQQLFMDHRFGSNWLPTGIYFSQYAQSGATYISTFEEDLNVKTSTIGGKIETENLEVWKEQLHTMMWNGRLTHSAFVGWDNHTGDTASYSFVLPDSLHVPDSTLLTFTLTQNNEVAMNTPIDFTIRLEDHYGESVEFLLSDCHILLPPVQKNLYKFRFLSSDKDSESIPDFFYFDLEKIKKQNPLFRKNRVKNIRLIFDKTPSGQVIIDNVGLMLNRMLNSRLHNDMDMADSLGNVVAGAHQLQ